MPFACIGINARFGIRAQQHSTEVMNVRKWQTVNQSEDVGQIIVFTRR